MQDNIYRIVVYLADSELTEDGVASIETPVARYVTEAMTGDDAVRRVADRLEAEEQFLWASSQATGLSSSGS